MFCDVEVNETHFAVLVGVSKVSSEVIASVGQAHARPRPLLYLQIQTAILLLESKVGASCGHSLDRPLVIPRGDHATRFMASLFYMSKGAMKPSSCLLMSSEGSKLNTLFALYQMPIWVDEYGPVKLPRTIFLQGRSCLLESSSKAPE